MPNTVLERDTAKSEAPLSYPTIGKLSVLFVATHMAELLTYLGQLIK